MAAQLVEAQLASGTPGLRRQLVEHPGVEKEMEVVGDGEDLGDGPEVLAANSGLAGLPPLALAVPGRVSGGEDGQSGISPQLLEDRSEAIHGEVHGPRSFGRAEQVTPL